VPYTCCHQPKFTDSVKTKLTGAVANAPHDTFIYIYNRASGWRHTFRRPQITELHLESRIPFEVWGFPLGPGRRRQSSQKALSYIISAINTSYMTMTYHCNYWRNCYREKNWQLCVSSTELCTVWVARWNSSSDGNQRARIGAAAVPTVTVISHLTTLRAGPYTFSCRLLDCSLSDRTVQGWVAETIATCYQHATKQSPPRKSYIQHDSKSRPAKCFIASSNLTRFQERTVNLLYQSLVCMSVHNVRLSHTGIALNHEVTKSIVYTLLSSFFTSEVCPETRNGSLCATALN